MTAGKIIACLFIYHTVHIKKQRMSFQECKTDMCQLSEPDATLNKKQLRSLQIAFHPDKESRLTPAQRERMAGRSSTQISQRVNECAPQFEDVNVSCAPPPVRDEESRRRAFDLGRSEAERARAAAYYEHKEQARRNAERTETERAETERAEMERNVRRRAETERAEIERAERQRFERERAETERAEMERNVRRRAETERAESERAERQRFERERAEMERLELVKQKRTYDLVRAEEERVRAAFAEEIAREAARSPGVRRPARYTTSADIEDSGVRQFMDFLGQPRSEGGRSTRGPRFC